MAKREERKSQDVFTLPEGRVINSSLFKKDAYDEKATPSYKIEIAIEKSRKAEIEALEDRLYDAADGEWGDGAGDDEGLIIPLLNGEVLKKKRENKGKEGTAYENMIVIRANTIWNRDGADGPGGIQVLDEFVEPVEPAASGKIYNGCYGIVGVTIGFYDDDRSGNHGLKFYLAAFQFTRDGERLASASDHSSLFKPREGGERESRRSRRSRRD